MNGSRRAQKQRAFSRSVHPEVGHRPGDCGVLSFSDPVCVTPTEGPMTINIARRQFISALGGAAFAWPLAARAQPSKTYRVGLLGVGTAIGASDERRKALLSVLAARGFIEGQNLVFEQRFANAHPEQLDGLVAELKAANVDVIVTFGYPAALAA